MLEADLFVVAQAGALVAEPAMAVKAEILSSQRVTAGKPPGEPSLCPQALAAQLRVAVSWSVVAQV